MLAALLLALLPRLQGPTPAALRGGSRRAVAARRRPRRGRDVVLEEVCDDVIVALPCLDVCPTESQRMNGVGSGLLECGPGRLA